MHENDATLVDVDFAGDADGFSADSAFYERFPIEKIPVHREVAIAADRRSESFYGNGTWGAAQQ